MSDYYLDDLGRFHISNYQNKRPFSNLMPGIAGPLGIPMWVFYVNRGQAISSFGVENKDHPIMEFQPANKAYQSTSLLGFRTFIKIIEGDQISLFEPFSGVRDHQIQEMIISLGELQLIEESHGLKTEILYFNLAEEPIAGLVRQVKITNLTEKPVRLEVLDGMPAIICYGVTNEALKETSRTIEAWIDISYQQENLPLFQLRSSLLDSEEVNPIKATNFSFALGRQNEHLLSTINLVSTEAIFGQDTSLRCPSRFLEAPLQQLARNDYYANGKTPCSFFGIDPELPPSGSITLYSVYGYSPNKGKIDQSASKFLSEDFFLNKRAHVRKLTEEITDPIYTRSGQPVFDAYSKQTFLDNVLRGGTPIFLGNPQGPKIYHINSRKHGDPERDYNDFYLAPEYYSQGNGNFRDINQNRRNEIWFDPRVGDSNVQAFVSLIQTDGYNPLVVKGSQFWMAPEKQQTLLEFSNQPEQLKSFFQKPFTPGGLLSFLENEAIDLKIPSFDFLQHALDLAVQYFDADFGEGFWIDHWTYNLDLINSFLSIYPDQLRPMLLGHQKLPFYESPVFVQPRSKKYILSGGQVRQFNAVIYDEEKAANIASRASFPTLTRTRNGTGSVYRTSLFSKLVFLALIKFSTLDPKGMGIEMEAGKPSWCDALNGLPGMFGSSMSETFELARLIEFLLSNMQLMQKLELPEEVAVLLETVTKHLEKYYNLQESNKGISYWDQVSTARETYREKTHFGFSGTVVQVPQIDLYASFELFLKKINEGIAQANSIYDGMPPTYFSYEIEEYEVLRDSDGRVLKDNQQRPYVRACKFHQNPLPLFLEAPVHMMRTLKNMAEKRQLHDLVKSSELYDQSLKMYRTNVSLADQPLHIGRLRVFTPGWLENESIFLHMAYKYMLELLKAGLFDEFFDDLRHALIAFQDPARYGRSPLENSSFLVSSAHPDESLHGMGFVARLTGATAEFLNMWQLMMVGQEPFFIQAGALHFQLRPALPEWLFDKDGKLDFTLFGKCPVTYFNPRKKNTYAEDMRITEMHVHYNGKVIKIPGNVIEDPYAGLLRDGLIQRIDVYFSED